MKLYDIANPSYREALSLNFLLTEMNLTCANNENSQCTPICLAYNDDNYVPGDAYKFISRVLSDFDSFEVEIL